MQDNDAGLLEFDEDDGDEPMDEEIDANTNFVDEDSNEEEDVAADHIATKKVKKNAIQEVTAAIFSQSMSGALNGSVKELKRIMAMFKAASQPLMKDDDVTDSSASSDFKYVIPNPEIYEIVMSGTIANIHKILAQHFELEAPYNKSSLEALASHRRWKKLQMVILIFFKIILQNLNATGLHVNHSKVTLFFLDSMENYLPFLTPLPRLTKTVIKVLLNIWAGPFIDEDQEKNYRNVRGHCFLRIRQLVLQLPGAVTEECLRMVYLKFARRCKNFTENSMSCVLYLTNCIAELYKCDVALAYQQAFLYVRQLALHLRAAYLKKGEAAMKVIRCWQFVNCLRLWTKVICTLPTSDAGLGVLCFPLSQIMLGVMALLPSPYYSPLRLHLVSFLQLLAANCKLYIPVGFNLCEILEYQDLFIKPTSSTDIPPPIQFLLNFPPNSMLKMPIRDALVNEVLHLLRSEIEIYKFNPGFPEYSYLISRKLKGFVKKCVQGKWRDNAKNLIGQIQQYAQEAKLCRSQKGFSPVSSEDFEALRPVNVLEASDRLLKLAASRSKLVSVSAKNAKNQAKTTMNEESVDESKIMSDDEESEEESFEDGDISQSLDDDSNEDLDDEVEVLKW